MLKASACKLPTKVRDPHNIKYRAVSLGNKTIAEKLLPANGAFEVCLINFDEL